MRQLGGMVLGFRPVDLLQCLAHLPVQTRSHHHWKMAVQRLAKESVPESEVACVPWHLDNHLRRYRLLQCFMEADISELAEPRQQIELELLAGYRRRHEDLPT
jgi:hypothetical protein